MGDVSAAAQCADRRSSVVPGGSLLGRQGRDQRDVPADGHRAGLGDEHGDRWIDTTAGDFLYVPQGGVHAFRNTSGKPASLLLLFTPGAPREAYFEELAEIAASGRRLSDEEWTDLYLRHDQYMV